MNSVATNLIGCFCEINPEIGNSYEGTIVAIYPAGRFGSIYFLVMNGLGELKKVTNEEISQIQIQKKPKRDPGEWLSRHNNKY